MLGRLIWLLVAIALVGGGMLLTVHYARAYDNHFQPTPGQAQLKLCLEYAADHKRDTTPGDKADWVYFCMEQKHWQFADMCEWKAPETYYAENCWTWIPPGKR